MQLGNHATRVERKRALTYEGPDEAEDVLREVEEREVLEPPPLRPEPLRGSEPPASKLTKLIPASLIVRRSLDSIRERERVLTESPEGRPGRCRRTRSRRHRRRGRPRAPPCFRRHRGRRGRGAGDGRRRLHRCRGGARPPWCRFAGRRRPGIS